MLMKRTIPELSNPEGVILSHIKQLTPWTFAIGSVVKTGVENPEDEANFKPYLHIVRGDVSELKEELKTKTFEIPIVLDSSDLNKAMVFRSLYVKERYEGNNFWIIT